jgi:hypothetical protein
MPYLPISGYISRILSSSATSEYPIIFLLSQIK